MGKIKIKNIFITGATGFTGGHLARRLAASGHHVRALARPGRETAGLESVGIEIVRGDLTDASSLAHVLDNIDIVYHIAAVYREENIPKHLFWDVNVTGTENLLKLALDHQVQRFVHCSTVGVQGEIKNPPATEEAPLAPGDYYQTSKLEGEKIALRYFREKGLPGVVFRPVGIYGPGDMRFFKLFKYVQNGFFPMIGSGNVLYHLTYIDDLVDGILLCGEKPGIEGMVFTLGGATYTTLNDLVDIISGVLDHSFKKVCLPVWPFWIAGACCEVICRPFKINPPIYRRRLDFFTKDRAFDISKAKEKLGYQPKVDLESGLKKMADWYFDQGLLK